ncbi:DUF6265 family protein [Sandaracinus amylolyticus]|uniref:DUF6265 family protein n=1 Tax=Sandaracinus amylolyticus TaxID=927083 RepID=UPI001F2FD84F|nr:DUF6265 family protein [Sandaracinus amylolyticus]UJR81351.1 Hypothetical protein I5071_34080 [Sandaracinus amylolyticus]
MATTTTKTKVLGAAFALAIGACGGSCPEARTTTATTGGIGPLAGYGFLAGTWVADHDDGARTEETWTVPRGSVMPGSSHTEAPDGRTRSWESLRIEQRGDAIFYVALPVGADGETSFAAVELEADRAVFENPQHDFPQRITYQLEGPEILRATVSDLGGATQTTWRMRRESR